MTHAGDLVVRGREYALGIADEEILWQSAAQEPVGGREPDRDVPGIELIPENLENGSETLYRPILRLRVERISG